MVFMWLIVHLRNDDVHFGPIPNKKVFWLNQGSKYDAYLRLASKTRHSQGPKKDKTLFNKAMPWCVSVV